MLKIVQYRKQLQKDASFDVGSGTDLFYLQRSTLFE